MNKDNLLNVSITPQRIVRSSAFRPVTLDDLVSLDDLSQPPEGGTTNVFILYFSNPYPRIQAGSLPYLHAAIFIIQ
jgi:hypothetical protein